MFPSQLTQLDYCRKVCFLITNFSDIFLKCIDMPLIDLFTAEITVLFVANRQGNTLKIVCSGAADYGRLVKTNVKYNRRHSISFRYACMQCLLQVRSIVSSYNDLKVELTYKIKIQPVDLFI